MIQKIGLIGGTDSSGGAGLQADTETCKDINCRGYPVISAITSQCHNQRFQITPVPEAGFSSQLDSLLNRCIDTIKIGMLPDADAVQAVYHFLGKLGPKKVILDPVQKTSSGYRLISPEGWDKMIDLLLPSIDLVTPNLLEAHYLLGINPKQKIAPPELAKRCLDLGPKAVLIKGGHTTHPQICQDLLLEANLETTLFTHQKQEGGTQIRGTGCRLGTAIACNWAKEKNLVRSIELAQSYLQNYIQKELA
jgi:hydroxymethylpyrimidine kinase/phosphomethylpyrimidine kinase